MSISDNTTVQDLPLKDETEIQFSDLNLNPQLLKSLKEIGYEKPSPIQAKTIPYLIAGKDLVGQAQTGTGKTAAFALPLLSRLDLKKKGPAVLVLTPTRELAIQVAEAFQRYASFLKDFHVLPIYGGSSMSGQIRSLQRGVHVIVGTPGRVMDHMRRGTLKLGSLQALVLDEADEMLRMGFIDDVDWILEQTPAERQIALFSATMPKPIRKIAQKFLNQPEEVHIKDKTSTADTINHRYCIASGMKKMDVLTRLLETEDTEGVLVFVRTKHSTEQFADKLSARGYACAALNGDIAQKTRERTVEKLKQGQLDIVVATDVAARGLDVQRISHVINFDIPHDTESYVHRVGRTGRAGRKGEAILFITPREKHMLASIERATKQKITLMKSPTREDVSQKRQEQFKIQIQSIVDQENLTPEQHLLEQYQKDWGMDLQKISAALLKIVQTKSQSPILAEDLKDDRFSSDTRDKFDAPRGRERSQRGGRNSFRDEPEMERYRVEVGRQHGIQVGNLVGAVANEGGFDSEFIGRIDLFDDHSTIDLPKGMSTDVYKHLQQVWVGGQQLQIKKMSGNSRPQGGRGKRPDARDKKFGGPAKKFENRGNKYEGSGKKFDGSAKKFKSPAKKFAAQDDKIVHKKRKVSSKDKGKPANHNKKRIKVKKSGPGLTPTGIS